jgi:hypothetical protein
MTHAEQTGPAPADGRNRFGFSAWLFLRLLGVVYLIAFASAWSQLAGLIGPHGLLPAQEFFDAVHRSYGARAYALLPSLCWIFGGGAFLPVLCAGGVALAALVIAGIAPAICLTLLWAGYLSLCAAGQMFFNFQWDALLLEATLPAIFLAPWSLAPGGWRREPPRLARWLLAWLLFRLMLLSGAVKLTSGDLAWRDLMALTFHYETQPLPTPFAWQVHQLPVWFHRAACAGLFAIELVAPFCLFGPRALRHRAALLIAGLMVAIALTGNYTFFNLLTVALCVACLDDQWWQRLLRRSTPWEYPLAEELSSGVAQVRSWLLRGFALFTFVFTALISLPALTRSPLLSRVLAPLESSLGPLRSFNTYGLFAVMTNPRAELIFEGSDDRRDWRAYELPDKPGALTRPPPWVAPHQPRLDWQLWFAALESPEQNRWVTTLCEQLLRGTPDVLALFATNPFPQRPPRFVRVVRYEYHFTDRATRARTGQWWRRTPLDFYVEPVSLP